MKPRFAIRIFLLTGILALHAQAQRVPAARYGTNGIAVAIDNLPQGRLRSRLETLPAPARERALKWLNRVSFPAQDVEFLRIDENGGVFYSDPLPEPISQSELEADPFLEGIAPVDTFQLHSKPGAPNVVYINTVGCEIAGTAWSPGTLYALPFDLNGDPDTFSVAEQVAIVEIWHRVAEDFAPFDIDVTTEPPASFGPNTGHIVVTKSVDATGALMPSNAGGGVAYIGVWGTFNYTTYQPALVYYNNLSSSPDFIAEACSHEFGHNLGLSHDGTSLSGYYSGHGPRAVKWCPIMGTAYQSDISQWSKGEYPDANNNQDDIAIITSHLNLRPDDHGDSLAGATPLLVDGNGWIASSNPEFDPNNQRTDNKGIINDRTDIDLFSFDAAAGMIELTVEPAWAAFFRTNREGVNLDLQARLLDASGIELARADDLLTTDAVIVTNVAAGRYYLEITVVGNETPIAGFPEFPLYSDYAGMGQFFIHGYIPAAEPDLTAPTPDPMTWSIPPEATGRSSITMTASLANDDSGIVMYQFVCTSHASLTSDWQADNGYTAIGLQADTHYTFQVRARDGSGNQTELSAGAGSTTGSNSVPESRDDTATVNEDTAVSIDVLANDTDADGDSLSVYSLTIPAHGDATITDNQVVYTPDSNYSGADAFQYTASDGFGGFSSSTVQVEVLDVNDAPIALDDSCEVLLEGVAILNVLANDTDAEGDTLTIASVTPASKGMVNINANNTLTYTVDGKKRGTDSFTYTVSDGTDTASAVVTIDIVRELTNGGTTGCEILSAGVSGGMINIKWSSAVGANYTILQRTNLLGGVWEPVVTNIPGGTTSTSNSIAIGDADTLFFQIEVQ